MDIKELTMDYRISPFANIWQDGIFNVPVALVDKYLKMTSEYQLKALLLVLRNNGQATSAQIAKALGQTSDGVDELLEFWIDEGVLCADNGTVRNTDSPAQIKKSEPAPEKPKPVKETISAPRLSPKDVVSILRDDEGLRFLLTEAQSVLGRTISHSEQEMMINMVNYYGLNPEIVLMILEFYRAQKLKGKSIGISHVNSMAKAWAEEGIDTIAQAEEKLKEIERTDRLWNEIVAMTGISHKRPTVNQRKMVSQWFEDFDITMISLACDIMKENTSEPKLTYINAVLKNWKSQGIKTPADAANQQEQKQQSKNKGSNDGKLKSKPSYDLEKIKRDAMNNTDI